MFFFLVPNMREEIERSPEYDNREIISVFTDSDHKNSRSWCQRVLFGEGEGGGSIYVFFKP
jgi:hypothetical protein